MIKTIRARAFRRIRARPPVSRHLSRLRFDKVIPLSTQPAGLSLLDLSLSTIKSGSKTQSELVAALQANGVLESDDLSNAMLRVDRSLFVPIKHDKAVYAEPYENKPSVIDAASKSTMSTPHHHCVVGELVSKALDGVSQVHGRCTTTDPVRILDLGSGTGVLSILFAELLCEKNLVGKDCSGQVIGADAVPALVTEAQRILESSIRQDPIGQMVAFEHAYHPQTGGGSLVETLAQRDGEPSLDIVHAGFAIPCDSELLNSLVIHLVRKGGTFVGPILDVESQQQSLATIHKTPAGELVKQIHMMPVFCQAMFDRTYDAKQHLSASDRAEQVKRQLEDWKLAFRDRNGRPPTKEELLGDPEASNLFAEFARCRKRVWDK